MKQKRQKKDTYLQRQQISDELRLIQKYNNEISKSNKFVRQCTKSTIQIQNKNWAEINDESRGTYNTNARIKFNVEVQFM